MSNQKTPKNTAGGTGVVGSVDRPVLPVSQLAKAKIIAAPLQDSKVQNGVSTSAVATNVAPVNIMADKPAPSNVLASPVKPTAVSTPVAPVNMQPAIPKLVEVSHVENTKSAQKLTSVSAIAAPAPKVEPVVNKVHASSDGNKISSNAEPKKAVVKPAKVEKTTSDSIKKPASASSVPVAALSKTISSSNVKGESVMATATKSASVSPIKQAEKVMEKNAQASVMGLDFMSPNPAMIKDILENSSKELGKVHEQALDMSKAAAENLSRSADKACKAANEMASISRETVQACIESGNAYADYSKSLTEQMMRFNSELFSRNVEMSRKFFTCRSANDVFDLQNSIVTSTIESVLNESGKILDTAFDAQSKAADKLQKQAAEQANRLNKIISN